MTEIFEQKSEVLFAADDIKRSVSELGKKINLDYKDKNLLVVGVLKGSFVFMADLLREIDLPLMLDFIKVHSYNKTRSVGEVSFDLDLSYDLKGKDVLVVEDILDTGRTLKNVCDHFSKRHANSIKTAVLLDKPSRRVVDITADYRCFEIPDKFVVGYGLDYDEQFRSLPYIAQLMI